MRKSTRSKLWCHLGLDIKQSLRLDLVSDELALTKWLAYKGQKPFHYAADHSFFIEFLAFCMLVESVSSVISSKTNSMSFDELIFMYLNPLIDTAQTFDVSVLTT